MIRRLLRVPFLGIFYVAVYVVVAAFFMRDKNVWARESKK